MIRGVESWLDGETYAIKQSRSALRQLNFLCFVGMLAGTTVGVVAVAVTR